MTGLEINDDVYDDGGDVDHDHATVVVIEGVDTSPYWDLSLLEFGEE